MIRSGGTLRSARLSTASQMALTTLAAAFVGWVGFSSFMYLSHQEILSSKQDEVVRARSAYKSLIAQVSVYRDKISNVTENLERNHSYTMNLLEQNTDLDRQLQAIQSELASSEAQRAEIARQKEELVGHLKKLKTELSDAVKNGAPLVAGDLPVAAAAMELQRERAVRERESLRAELSRLENEMGEVANDPLLTSEVDTIEVELRKVVLQRDLALADADSLRERVSQLEEHLADLESTQLALFQRFASLARDRIDELEGALGKTGLNIDDLLQEQDNRAQGGPFVPLEVSSWDQGALKGTVVALNNRLEHWSSLQNLAESLPLGQPLEDFFITSHFGPRKDPMNKRAAMHQGLDMGAPYKSPIYATGPGKISFAGWRGRYGRLVEIDHGNGVKTRFGHLSKILVKKGDLVDRSSKVGLLGSSGRSTGPHLHYEVLVDGKPRNPFTFIKAGVNVFKG